MGSPVRPGEVVNGKYCIRQVIGEGGMGVVVAAHHLALDQPIAIKFLLASLVAHPAIVERFAREARAASKLQSDHVVRVMDVDALDVGIPFMVMEYLDGEDLSFVRREGRTLPVAQAVGFVLEACNAIGEAHRLGIVHRDLKPANLFLAKRPDGKTRVKVLDFGISKMEDRGGVAGAKVTKTSAVMGSAEYMSPEQMLSTRDADWRTDIWALGVTLYELLTGQVPFAGETVTQVYAAVMSHPARPPSELRSDLPPELDSVILTCLARERDQRHPSIAALVGALEPFAAPSQSSNREAHRVISVAPRGFSVRPPATTSPIRGDETTLTDEAMAHTDRAPQRSSGGTHASGQSGDTSGTSLPSVRTNGNKRWMILLVAAAISGFGYFAWSRAFSPTQAEPTWATPSPQSPKADAPALAPPNPTQRVEVTPTDALSASGSAEAAPTATSRPAPVTSTPPAKRALPPLRQPVTPSLPPMPTIDTMH